MLGKAQDAAMSLDLILQANEEKYMHAQSKAMKCFQGALKGSSHDGMNRAY